MSSSDRAKAPNSKLQAPTNVQIPSTKIPAKACSTAALGFSSLEVLWSLEVGGWDFISRFLQYRHCHIRAGAGMRVDQAASRVVHLEFVVSEMLRNRVLQLPEHCHLLHQTGGADRMAAGDQ